MVVSYSETKTPGRPATERNVTGWDWDNWCLEARVSPLELLANIPVDDNGRRFDIRLAPWMNLIFDWFTDPTVEVIWQVCGSQMTKTTGLMLLLLYAGMVDPGPAMWIGTVENEVKSFSSNRLKPFLEGADSRAKTGRKKDWKDEDLKLFGRMPVRFAWSNSPAKMRSWPCRYVIGDEAGLWPRALDEVGDVFEYLRKRTRTFRNRKLLFATTLRDQTHPSWGEASSCNFYQWWVPCPECGEYQFLNFFNLKFAHARRDPNALDLEDRWDLGKVEAETYYECPHCRAKIVDSQKEEMIMKGRAQCVDPDTYEPAEVDPANTGRCLQNPSTYSMFTPWGRLAVMFLKAKAGGVHTYRVFVTDELAQPWKGASEAPEMSKLLACMDTERAPMSIKVLENIIAITAGADVQYDIVYYVIRAWGWGERSYLIRHGAIPRGADRSISMLDDVLMIDYGGRRVDMAFVDSGYQPDDVYAYCLQRTGVYPSKGASYSLPQLVKPSQLERHKGKPLPDGIVLMLVNTDHFKTQIHDRIKVGRGNPREWRLHGEVDELYLRQILAEKKVPKKRGVGTGYEWILADKAAGNHYFDAEVLAAAAAWYPVRVQRFQSRGDTEQTPVPAAPAGATAAKQAEAARASRREGSEIVPARSPWKPSSLKGFVR